MRGNYMNNDLNDLKKTSKNIINKILSEIPEKYTDLEKARYIYIQLGKFFSYDEQFIISNSDEEKKFIFNKNLNDIENDKVICTLISKIYEYMLNKLGISAKTILVDGRRMGHAYTEMTINNLNYKADLIYDLMNIKTGFKTKKFMIKNEKNPYYSYITEEKLKEIDDKIGYTYKRNVY